MRTARVHLPLPPSANALFVERRRVRGKAGGRTITEEYRRWRETAGTLLNVARLPYIGGPVSIEIELPAKMRGDISNRIKALEDLLVAHRLIDDDRHVWRITVERRAMLIDEARVTFSMYAERAI